MSAAVAAPKRTFTQKMLDGIEKAGNKVIDGTLVRMTELAITHIGGPTTLIDIGGWRILTDPTFDPPGGRYAFGWGTSSRKLTGPAIAAAELPPIDAVLISHDGHGDNLDPAGRRLLPGAGTVLTTVSGARRLRGNARGLTPWATATLAAPGRPTVRITATPGRHGPPLSRAIVGDVIGFDLRWPGGNIWISGDTVLYDGLREVGKRLDIDVAVIHLGGVRFPISGPIRYTMLAHDAVELCELIRPRMVIPVHYEGWKHFQQPREAVEGEFATAPAPIRDSLSWLSLGERTTITAAGRG